MNDSHNAAAALLDLSPSQAVFLEDVVAGLSGDEKTLPCKYFYDRRGSQLFDRICELDEYYLTRTEIGIMRHNADAIAAAVGPGVALVELGSGSSVKTRILLDHLREPAVYVPVDICRAHLLHTVESLAERYPRLQVSPVSADFTEPFDLPETVSDALRCVVYFPGSTIGNFSEDAAAELLQQISDLCGPGGGLLIGIDLKKDAAVLEAAYNDASGVTAEFNLNILRRINRELDADFDLDAFRHKAVHNAEAGRMEVSLVSRMEQTVVMGDDCFEFEAGEEICTEHCHKYDLSEFAKRTEQAGLRVTNHWTDERNHFAVLFAQNRSRSSIARLE